MPDAANLLLCIMLSLAGLSAIFYGLRSVFSTPPMTPWKSIAKDLWYFLYIANALILFIGSLLYGIPFALYGGVIYFFSMGLAIFLGYLPKGAKRD